MISPHSLAKSDRELVSPGALHGASNALIVTAVIGGSALLLELVWPWLAWGYVFLALAVGFTLAVLGARTERALEREVENLRRQHRSG